MIAASHFSVSTSLARWTLLSPYHTLAPAPLAFSTTHATCHNQILWGTFSLGPSRSNA